jgi:LPXTG-motif cell wall-anchored protein
MQRTTATLLTGALAAGGFIGLAALAPSIASASCAGPITVTEDDTKGWLIPDTGNTNGGTATFNPNAELNLVLNAGPGNVRISYLTRTPAQLQAGEGIPLADMTSQSNYEYDYQRYEGGPSESGAPAYQLTMDTNGPAAGGFATLVYEPVYQGANPGTWWSTRPNPGQGPAPIHHEGGHGSDDWGTLAEFSQAYPDAVIQAFGVNQAVDPNGASADSGISSLDSVKFGCNVFLFDGGEAAPVNEAPVADLDATGPTAEGDVTYTAPSTDDKGVVRHTLDFGDGTSTEGGPTDRGPITHRYAPGTYTATLTAYDAEGLSDTDTFTFTYTAPVPPNDGIANGPLPDTGADVLGLAVLGGVAVAGAGSGLALRNRRRSHAAA